jgi:anti-sigma-K factor RskA
MAEEPFAEDLPLYALGAVHGEARKRLEEALAGSETLDAELEAWRSAAALLPYAAPRQPLPPELKARVMERIATVKPSAEFAAFPPPLPRHRTRWVGALAAALLIAAILGILLATAKNEVALLQSEKSSLAALLKEQERETAWLKDPRVQVSLLRGLAASPSASARLVWHPETKQGILYATGLLPLPLGKSYELWAYVDGAPQPAGVFQPAPDGTAVFVTFRQEPLGRHPQKFAVSVEPEGGAPGPSGAFVLVGGPI